MINQISQKKLPIHLNSLILDRMVHYDFQQRYQSATEVSQQLQGLRIYQWFLTPVNLPSSCFYRQLKSWTIINTHRLVCDSFF